MTSERSANLPALMVLQTREFRRRYLLVPKAQWELEGGLLRILRGLFKPAFETILKRLGLLAVPNPASDPALLRPLQDLREPFGNAVGGEAVRAAAYGSDQIARQVKSAGFVAPDPTIPSVIANLIRSEAFLASGATLTRMVDDAREHLARAFEQDLTVEEAAKDLGKVFEGMLDHELRRIAQTEINSYRNRGSHELLLMAGIPYHQWLTVEDLRVRHAHDAIHGQVVRVGERFSNNLLFPGDKSTGLIREFANCRCRHVPYAMLGRLPPGGKRFFFPRDLIPAGVLKHLPGEHDQSTHGRRGAKGPDDSSGPNAEWFRQGKIDPNKFDPYLFDPDHPDNRGKARLWRSFFGIGKGDGPLLDRLIRDQLDQATIEEKTPSAFKEDPGKSARRWELLMPRFRGPNNNVAPVLTGWALAPGNDRPHMTTARPVVGQEGEKAV